MPPWQMEERKGKNCKIIQEFCLWGTATQFVGAGDGSPCQRTSSWTYSGIYQMFYQKSFNIHRLTYLTRLRLTTGVSTVSVTQCMHSYPPRRRASCGVAPGLCSPQPVAKRANWKHPKSHKERRSQSGRESRRKPAEGLDTGQKGKAH